MASGNIGVAQSSTTTKGRPRMVHDKEVRISPAWYMYKNEITLTQAVAGNTWTWNYEVTRGDIHQVAGHEVQVMKYKQEQYIAHVPSIRSKLKKEINYTKQLKLVD